MSVSALIPNLAAAILAASGLGAPRAPHHLTTLERPHALDLEARDLNDRSEILAVERRPSAIGAVGFVWSPATGARDLALPAAAEEADPRRLDDHSRVFGAAGPALEHNATAVWWPDPARPVPLERTAPGAREFAIGIDAAGRVVGNAVAPDAQQAVAWSADGAFQNHPFGEGLTRVQALDRTGSAWGERLDPQGPALLRIPTPAPTPTPVPEPAETPSAADIRLADISASGLAVGVVLDRRYRCRPVLRTPDGEIVELDIPGAALAKPVAVNARGLVALRLRDHAGRESSALWSHRLGLRPVAPLLPSHVDPAAARLVAMNERDQLLLDGAARQPGEPAVPALFLLRLNPADFNLDGRVTGADLADYLAAFAAGDRLANLHRPADTPLDVSDLLTFLAAYHAR